MRTTRCNEKRTSCCEKYLRHSHPRNPCDSLSTVVSPAAIWVSRSRTIRPAGEVDPVRNAPVRPNSAGPASEVLEDEHPVGRDADLDPAAADGDVRAEVADVVAAVDRRVAVERLPPEAARQPRRVGLDDVAVEEGLIPEAGDDEQAVGAD